MKMGKIMLLLIIVALCRNSYCFDLFGNYSQITKVVKEIIFKNVNLTLVNNDCIKQLGQFLLNLVTTHDENWALTMMDASARIPSGIMTVNLAWLGNYDECLAITSPKDDVKGRYCLIGLKFSIPQASPFDRLQIMAEKYNKLKVNHLNDVQAAVLPSVGVCIPDKCHKEDLKNVLNWLTKSITFSFTCQTNDDLKQPMDSGAIFTLCYFGFIIVLMIFSTMYDVYCDKNSEPHPLLIAFSTYTNGKKLFKMSQDSDQLSCLNGIRFLSMLWVIVGHEILSFLFAPMVNFVEIIKFLQTTRGMLFASGVYSVDTFFVVGGFLVTYNLMKTHSQGQKFNVLRFYWHRYLRLTNALIPVLLSTIFLIKYLGSGPFYPQTDQFSQTCRKYWWTTVLYIQNYINVGDRCLGHTWYLNVDLQLYVLSPIFLLFLPKRPKIGLSLMLCATIGVMITSFVITWTNKLESLMTNVHGDLPEFINKYYMRTYTRAAPWLIGAIVGYILGKIKFQDKLTSVTLPKWFVGFNWIIVLITIPTCTFAGVHTLNSEEYHPYSSAFYNTFAKPAWGACIAWIIFSCSLGYGGFINTILSLPIFQVPSKLTYSMYLLHHMMLYMVALSQKEPRYYSLFTVAYSFWGIFALTFGLSIFWVLAFELPIPPIDKCITSGIARLVKRKQEVRNGTSTECLVSSNLYDTGDDRSEHSSEP